MEATPKLTNASSPLASPVGADAYGSDTASSGRGEVYRNITDHLPRLQRIALALTHNRDRADDLLQNAIVRALDKSDRYCAGTNLRAWLCTILRHEHISAVRRERGRKARVPPAAAAARLTSAATAESRLDVDRIESALADLPPTQRRSIELVAFAGLSYEEAGAELHVEPGTVKSRISRGRARLRDIFAI